MRIYSTFGGKDELMRIGIFDKCPVCEHGELEPFEASVRLWGQKGYSCPHCGRVIVDSEFKEDSDESLS